jgi:hypothetical protein
MNNQFTPMEVDNVLVFLKEFSGGFSVASCPNPQELAKFIVNACNAHEDFVVLATLITRLNAAEGLSPAGLDYLIDSAKKVLQKAGAA